MQRYTLRALLIICLLTVGYSQTDTINVDRGKMFIGTSAFILVNLVPNQDNPPDFFQINYGFWLTNQDVISLEAITWKYNEPLGIPYGPSKEDPKEAYPGTVRDFGLGIAYQRFLWKSLYAAQHIIPLIQTYDTSDKKGVMLFLTTRVGYHVRLFKNKFFLEPSLACTYWPIRSNVPSSYKEMDEKWPSYFLFEPGLHLGIKF